MTTVLAEEVTAHHCVALNRIDLGENSVLNKEHQRELFRPYMGKCIDGKLLKAIIADISGFYMKRGYITIRPYMKRQSIADGQIDISVLKGAVEDIVDASTKEPNARIRTAFAFQKGRLLNLRDIETSLEMINRPPSSHATFAIKPGSKPGASVIEVKNQDTSPFHLNIGVTGRRQADRNETFLTAEASVDNPLNINDILTFRLNGNRVQRERQSTRAGEFDYSFPVSSYLLEFIASRFFYQQGIQGVNDTFLADGRTDGLRARVSKVLMRDQARKINVAASIYHRNSRNFLAGQLIQVSSYKTTLLQLDVTHAWLQHWGGLTATYSYYQGTGWFGARKDGFFGAQTGAQGQARLQFRKHSLDVDLDYRFPDKSYRFTSRAYIQRTWDELFDNDKLSVGGDYTVRGYPDGSLYGNNAWYVRDDLTKSWAVNLNLATLQSFSLLAGFDYGHVRCEADNPLSCGNIYGVVAGMRSRGRYLISSLTFGWPLKKVSAAFKRRPTLRLDMTWGF
ncbi:MAG: ShlB/FhaC/HecB family hemolysin secretion/activation protein [Mariprofundaceae bacterium]|nr:ShlB/FhaC/HecB family hemolysin secretion/activation protein [Mariprofundaceae bacterium]